MQQYSAVCTVSAHSAVHRRSPRYVYLTGENVISITPSLLFLVDQAFPPVCGPTLILTTQISCLLAGLDLEAFNFEPKQPWVLGGLDGFL